MIPIENAKKFTDITPAESVKEEDLILLHDGTGVKSADFKKIKASLFSNHNFFDNWYFIGGGTNGNFPINQQGKLNYVGTGYGISMWNNFSGSSQIELTEPYMILKGCDLQGQYVRLNQIFPGEIVKFLSGKTVTFSLLCDGGYRFYLAKDSTQDDVLGFKTSITDGVELVTSTIVLPDNLNYLRAEFGNSSFSNVSNVYAAKLELGSVSTLARQDTDGNWILNDPPPNYGIELLKCQRYYQLYSSAAERPAKAVDCRPMMRIDPTQGTIVIDGVTYYYNDANL